MQALQAVSVDVVASHLARVSEEAARARRATIPLRASSALAVCVVSVWHASMQPARYMWVAPLLALGFWSLDATLGRRAAAFERLSAALRGEVVPPPPPHSLDPTPYEAALSVRAQWLEPARALFYGALVTFSAAVAVDAQQFPPAESLQEVVWYLFVALGALTLLALIAWSWWVDRFQLRPRAPAVLSAPAPAASAPQFAPPVSMPVGAPGPFPVRAPRPSQEPPVPPPSAPPVSLAPPPGPFPVRAEPIDIVQDDPNPREPEPEPEAPAAPRTSVPTSTFGTPPAVE